MADVNLCLSAYDTGDSGTNWVADYTHASYSEYLLGTIAECHDNIVTYANSNGFRYGVAKTAGSASHVVNMSMTAEVFFIPSKVNQVDVLGLHFFTSSGGSGYMTLNVYLYYGGAYHLVYEPGQIINTSGTYTSTAGGPWTGVTKMKVLGVGYWNPGGPNAYYSNTHLVEMRAWGLPGIDIEPDALTSTLTLGTHTTGIGFTPTTDTIDLVLKDVTLKSSYNVGDEALNLTLLGPTLRIDSSVTTTTQTLALTLKDSIVNIPKTVYPANLEMRVSLKPATIQRYIRDPIDKSGCPMCGTYLYRRGVNQVPKRRIFSEPVRHGRNFDRGEYKDDAYIKCSKCGFICNTQRDQYAPEGSRVGWGVKYEEVEAG